jgi:nitrate reductase assembly molybdenum cofactor insertion protein NarJ
MLTFKVLAALLVYPERELIESLAEIRAILEAENALPEAERRALAESWRREAEQLAQWPVEAVERVLEELKDLAGRASREGKAVLYLATW